MKAGVEGIVERSIGHCGGKEHCKRELRALWKGMDGTVKSGGGGHYGGRCRGHCGKDRGKLWKRVEGSVGAGSEHTVKAGVKGTVERGESTVEGGGAHCGRG